MMRMLVAAAAAAVAFAGCTVQTLQTLHDDGTDRVTRVVDGDTFHADRDGRDVTVRPIGIDTPETKDPRKPVECGGPEASAFAHEQLDGAQVTLTLDPTQDDTDRYGRTLAYVDVDGRDYGLEALRAGHAVEYTYGKPYARQRAYRAAQREARAAHRGLWSHCKPTPRRTR